MQKYILAGKVYEVTFSQEEAEGILPEPVAVTLAYDATDVDEELLGVYYYNEESEQWEYMGGEILARKCSLYG